MTRFLRHLFCLTAAVTSAIVVFAVGRSFATAPVPVPAVRHAGFSLAMIDLASVDGRGPLPGDLVDKGVIIVMNRATIGVGSPDPVFEDHSNQAVAAGLAPGAYHVPFPTHSADAQADEFVGKVRKICKPGVSVLLALDWEEVCVKRDVPIKNGVAGTCRIKRAATPAQILALVRAFKARTNNSAVLIYTRPDIIAANRGAIDPSLAQEPLWVAQYWHSINGHPANYLPSPDGLTPWSDWDFWQWTEGNSPNLSTHISATYGKGNQAITPDQSLYNGLPDDLYNFLSKRAWYCGG